MDAALSTLGRTKSHSTDRRLTVTYVFYFMVKFYSFKIQFKHVIYMQQPSLHWDGRKVIRLIDARLLHTYTFYAKVSVPSEISTLGFCTPYYRKMGV